VHLSSLRVGRNSISITICSRHLLLLTSICLYSKKDGDTGMGGVGDQTQNEKEGTAKAACVSSLLFFCFVLRALLVSQVCREKMEWKEKRYRLEVHRDWGHMLLVWSFPCFCKHRVMFTLGFTELLCLCISTVCTSCKWIKSCRNSLLLEVSQLLYVCDLLGFLGSQNALCIEIRESVMKLDIQSKVHYYLWSEGLYQNWSSDGLKN